MNTENIPSRKPPFPMFIIIVLIVFGLVYTFFYKKQDTDIKETQYQAVFLTNGQVYFGKLETGKKDFMKLSDVYYLQVSEQLQQTSDGTQSPTTEQNSDSAQEDPDTAKTDVSLIKLGNEVHGPEDSMMIGKDQILFYENLKSDSQVVKLIEEGKK